MNMYFTKKRINETWNEYTISNDYMSVSFLNYGCIITKVIVPDKFGNKENVVLSYNDYTSYIENQFYLGAIIGRVAGRIKNGEAKIDGQRYELERNESNHHLHGGKIGFHKVLWSVTEIETVDGIGAQLSYVSRDGEGGYPGNVIINVTYLLTNDTFHICFEAESDKKTLLTLTNHSYFNLSGNLKETIENHNVKMNCDRVLLLDEELIAKKMVDVTNSPFDFRDGNDLKQGLQSRDEQIRLAGMGYDHYFLFDHSSKNEVFIKHSSSGRNMIIRTDQPGLVMYTSNAMENGILLNGVESKKYLGVCIETQAPPSSLWINHLPTIYLVPDEKYKRKTSFKFIVER